MRLRPVFLNWLIRLYRHSPDAGLQMPVFCASGAHVPKRTLRSGAQEPTFSPLPELNVDTTWQFRRARPAQNLEENDGMRRDGEADDECGREGCVGYDLSGLGH